MAQQRRQPPAADKAPAEPASEPIRAAVEVIPASHFAAAHRPATLIVGAADRAITRARQPGYPDTVIIAVADNRGLELLEYLRSIYEVEVIER